mmetsp:Transcript_23328/g.42080  ORF Transcript_23328/g.42080 Transcript_23328/m.42080 type:complete len:138 (-) Transcript_23328:28-441(-)
MKPTNIWTNDWKLGNILETIGGKCDCPLPHEDSVRRTGHEVNFAALPLKLCQIISSCVHSKHTQLRFETFAKNGSNIGTIDSLPPPPLPHVRWHQAGTVTNARTKVSRTAWRRCVSVLQNLEDSNKGSFGAKTKKSR